MVSKLNLSSKLSIFDEGHLNSEKAKRLFKMINDSIKNESVLKLKAYKREDAFGTGG